MEVCQGHSHLVVSDLTVDRGGGDPVGVGHQIGVHLEMEGRTGVVASRRRREGDEEVGRGPPLGVIPCGVDRVDVGDDAVGQGVQLVLVGGDSLVPHLQNPA